MSERKPYDTPEEERAGRLHYMSKAVKWADPTRDAIQGLAELLVYQLVIACIAAVVAWGTVQGAGYVWGPLTNAWQLGAALGSFLAALIAINVVLDLPVGFAKEASLRRFAIRYAYPIVFAVGYVLGHLLGLG